MLDRYRLSLLCGSLLAFEIVAFVFLAAGTHGLIVRLSKPSSSDFVSFYAAGSLADAGTPQLAYDHRAHYAAEQRAVAPGIGYNLYYYPPVFLLLCALLARLPYVVAFVVFETGTLGCFLLVMRRILDQRDWVVLIAVLAFPPVLWTIGFGQNGLLTASLFGAATLLVDRRPVLAGLLFGALCYKPHYALLVPVALAAAGRWRAFAAAAAGAIGLCVLSLIVFGWPTWMAFLAAAAASPSVYDSGHIPFELFVTPFGAVRLLGGSLAASYIAQGVTTLAAAMVVAIVWRRELPLPVRAATLIAATLVAVPLALFYDLVLAAVAGAWLLRIRAPQRLPEWVEMALAGLYVLTLNPRNIGGALSVPVGSLIALTFAVLVAAIALRGQDEAAGHSLAAPAR
ncbi:MAG: glycosyltransferase family 87 protein [Stellaceae bacterium]